MVVFPRNNMGGGLNTLYWIKGGAQFLLDAYPTDVVWAYSFRKLRDAYAGSAVRIREDGGDTEADIGFDVDGNFDTAAAASHIGANNGFITIWYDQSGNGYNVTQPTAANQPSYSATAFSSLPTMEFLGSANQVLSSASFDLSSHMTSEGTTFLAMQQDGSVAQQGTFHWGDGSSDPRYGLHATYEDVIYFDHANDSTGRINVSQPGGWDDTPHIVELYRDNADEQGIVVDGSSLITGTRTDDVPSSTKAMNIGFLFVHYTGMMSELVTWGTDLGSAGRSGARTNINNFWGAF